MDNQSVISKDDSYTERRKLFKNIWDTAITMDDKEPESGPKPKVIKTLRLSEKDGINIAKSKKQRIKNLRTVCTRLLEFCDRPDADADLLYDQMSAACENSNSTSVVFTLKPKHKKKHKKKKKVQQTYSYTRPREREHRQDKTKTSFVEVEVRGPVTHRGTRPVRSSRIERATLIQQFIKERYALQKAPVSDAPSTSEQKLRVGDAPCKVVKRKYRKGKKAAPISSQLPSVTSAQIKRVHTRSSKRKKST